MRQLQRVDEGLFTYSENGGTAKFAVRFQHRGRDWRKFGFPTITKARQWLRSRKGRAAEYRLFPERERADLEQAENGIPLFQDYAWKWLDGCKAKQLKHSTLKRYKGILEKHLIPTFGLLRLNVINRGLVRELAYRMDATKAAPKTIHNVVRVLSAIFEQGNEDELVTHNPARNPSKLVKVTRSKDQTEVFTQEEESLILAATKVRLPEYYGFILLLFRTGMRVGEASALMPEDMDLRSRYILIQRNLASGIYLEESPKSGKNRRVDISADLVPILKEHLAMREAEAALTGTPPAPWLFTMPQGDMIRSNNFRHRVWRALLKALAIRYRCVHTIRHTYATRLIMAGANLVYVQRQLGHSTIKVTVDLYTHWIEEIKRDQNLEVDRLLQPSADLEVGTLVGTSQQPHA